MDADIKTTQGNSNVGVQPLQYKVFVALCRVFCGEQFTWF